MMHPDYRARRTQLLTQMPTNSLALLFAKAQDYRNHDTEYPFRQDSNFYYLTGLNEPDLIVVLEKTETKTRQLLFCHPYDEQVATWIGPRLSLQQALHLQFDEAYLLSDFEAKMRALLRGKEQVLTVWQDAIANRSIGQYLQSQQPNTRKGEMAPAVWQNLALLIHEQRVHKLPEEISRIQHAIDISVEGHLALMSLKNKIGLHEYVLEAKLLETFYRRGASGCAYPSIIGAGNNACILHYHQNRSIIEKDELILIDAGAEYDFYASDITRTIPAGGRYTRQQRELYEIVLHAQEAGIAACQAGKPYQGIQAAILKTMIPGLVDLGILSGSMEEILEKKTYQSVYMHSSGHYLGLDVHDCGVYQVSGASRLLEPNMILTVEPGIYIRPDHPTVAAEWHGLGIRIEDDILITEKEPVVLSASLPKTIDAIESLAS